MIPIDPLQGPEMVVPGMAGAVPAASGGTGADEQTGGGGYGASCTAGVNGAARCLLNVSPEQNLTVSVG